MSALKLSELALAAGGELYGEAEFSSVSTDTRLIVAGDLFVALSGEHFNGNAFVDAAANAGAIAAVVDESVEISIPHLKVSDARLAFGILARENRRKFSGPLIALTGSAGKTTTKEMLASILQQLAPVLATQDNLNNEVGVPKTLLAIAPEHQFAVIEMGQVRRGIFNT
nr:Mur ligase family protein [Oceanicoccus sp. KOV_DT_Chl]